MHYITYLQKYKFCSKEERACAAIAGQMKIAAGYLRLPGGKFGFE